ncbi:MAG: sigma-70 family RNA polymerase sigma factor [Owenweeksia sp.]
MQKDLEKILKKCLKNDQLAQHELYHLCFERLMRTCVKFQRNREDAVALLNDGFLKILLNLDKYDFKKDFFPWISTIMVRTAIDHYRKSKDYKETIDLQLDVYNYTGYGESVVYNDVIEKMEQVEVDNLLHALPKNEKVVFNLFEMEGYAHKEIAEMLNISERSSKRYLQSAKGRLREMLEKKTEIKKVV